MKLSKYKTKILIYFLLAFSTVIKISAQINADSLEAALKTNSKSEKLTNLNILSEWNRVKFPGKAIEYGLQAQSIANELNDIPGKINALLNIGNAHLYLGDNKLTLNYYLQALEIAKASSEQKNIARVLIKIGNYYNQISVYADALKYDLDALKIYKSLDDKPGLSDCYHNIGIVYYYLGNLEKSLEFNKNALEIREKLNDKVALVKSLNDNAMIYMAMGDNNKALELYFKALKLIEEINDISYQAYTFNNIGITYQQMKENDKAIIWYLKSLALYDQITDNRNKSILLVCLGRTYTDLKKYDKAENFLEQGLSLAKKSGYLDMVAMNYKCLAELYLELGNYKKTLDFKNLYYDIKDSVFNDANKQRITELQTMIETDNTQRESLLINEKNRIMTILFIILAITIAIIVIILYSRYSARRKADIALNKLNFNNYEANLSIEKLILWSNFQNGTYNFASKDIFLSEEINKCINLLKPYIDNKKIEIIYSGTKEQITIADSTVLNLILRDLILYSIKYSLQNEKVTIITSTNKEFIEVSFTYSALSIKGKELSEHLGINIQRDISDTDLMEKQCLVLCKKFVEKSGGKIWVESTDDKKIGMKFTLPVKSLS